MSPRPGTTQQERNLLTWALSRVGSVLRRHGVTGSLRLIATRAGQLAYLRQAHVWYWLGLPESGLSSIEPVARFDVINASESDLALIEPSSTIGILEARRRLAMGIELWIVLEGDSLALACWIHRNRMPAVDGRRGLRLPRAAVGLEVAALAEDPGRDAPEAWLAIAARLAEGGTSALLIRVDETDLPVRRAIETAGFRAIASMELERIGGRWRVELRPYSTKGMGALLARQVAR